MHVCGCGNGQIRHVVHFIITYEIARLGKYLYKMLIKVGIEPGTTT